MKAFHLVENIKNALVRGVFPPELSFFLELPWRFVVLSPQKLVSRLPIESKSRVLKIGAGSGFYSLEAARKISNGRLQLLDIQLEILKKAQRKIQNQSLNNADCALADAADLPFEENCFDVIFLVTVFGEIFNRRAFLNEARRVLKSEGILSISEHLPDPDFSPFYKVKSFVEQEGFEFNKQYGNRWNYTANFKKSI